MQFTIKALIICYFKLITVYHYDDGFGFDRTTICTDSASIQVKGKYKVTDSTVIVYKPGVTQVYYWYKCPDSLKINRND